MSLRKYLTAGLVVTSLAGLWTEAAQAEDFVIGAVSARTGFMAAYDAPFPDQSYKGGVRRFPEIVMLKGGDGEDLTPLSSEGVETSLQARKFWSEEWKGDSFMAIGMQDPVLGPPAMHMLRKMIKDCPAPMEIAEAGHFVQEWGGPIAKAALEKFEIA